VCCNVVQCVAVCCSVLRCVAVCCSVLQCVAKIRCQLLPDLAMVHGWYLCDRLQCVAVAGIYVT